MSNLPADLRVIAESFAASGDNHIAEKLRNAADTIEALRESLELEKSNSSFWKRKYTEERHRRSRR